MSIQVMNVRKQKQNETACLFCDKTSDLVKTAEPQSFENIRRKDKISKIIQTSSNTIVLGIKLVWQVTLVKKK